MAIPDYQIKGATTFRLKPDKLRKPAREIHTLAGHWQVPSSEFYKVGNAPPDFPNMRIVAADEDCEVVDAAYELRIDCEGIIGDAEYLELDFSERQPEEGWDEVRLRVFTRDPSNARWARGARLTDDAGAVVPGYEYMFIVDRSPRKHRAAGYWELDLTLKGLRESKPYKRRINGAKTTSNSKFDGYTLLTTPIYENFPPTDSGDDLTLDGESISIEYDSGSLTLSDTYLSTSPPPTEFIGLPWVPPDPPDVTVLTLSGEETKYFWPFGWKCESMPAEQIPGTDLWLVTVNYTVVPASVPVTLGA